MRRHPKTSERCTVTKGSLSEVFGGPLRDPLGESFSSQRLSVLLPFIVLLSRLAFPATEPPDPRRVYEGVSEGVYEGVSKGFLKRPRNCPPKDPSKPFKKPSRTLQRPLQRRLQRPLQRRKRRTLQKPFWGLGVLRDSPNPPTGTGFVRNRGSGDRTPHFAE